jgi:hypothetical protein
MALRGSVPAHVCARVHVAQSLAQGLARVLDQGRRSAGNPRPWTHSHLAGGSSEFTLHLGLQSPEWEMLLLPKAKTV